MTLFDYLIQLGLQKGQHILLHASFRRIRKAFPELSMHELIYTIQDTVSPNGSIIMPAFTYNFKKSVGAYELFDRKKSPSKVGAVSEFFRCLTGVERTSSATHSFALWGRAQKYILSSNAPASPLGEGSVLHWLAENRNSYCLLLGTDFTSLSFCHYLEIMAQLPWVNTSSWDYLNVLETGVSVRGEQQLIQIPGCSKPFKNLEKFLLEQNLVKAVNLKGLSAYFIPIGLLMDEGLSYFREHMDRLLCPIATCQPCDSRLQNYLHLQKSLMI